MSRFAEALKLCHTNAIHQKGFSTREVGDGRSKNLYEFIQYWEPWWDNQPSNYLITPMDQECPYKSCETCTPVDCVFGAWSAWSGASCTQLCHLELFGWVVFFFSFLLHGSQATRHLDAFGMYDQVSVSHLAVIKTPVPLRTSGKAIQQTRVGWQPFPKRFLRFWIYYIYWYSRDILCCWILDALTEVSDIESSKGPLGEFGILWVYGDMIYCRNTVRAFKVSFHVYFKAGTASFENFLCL